MLDFNKPVQTKSGRKVDILRTGLNNSHSVVGVMTYTDDTKEYVRTWKEDGMYSSIPSDMDLVNEPEETVEYIVVYADGDVGKTSMQLSASLCVLGISYVLKVTLVDGKVVKSEPYELV